VVEVEVGIDENNDMLKQKLDLWLFYALLCCSRPNV